MSAGSSSTTSSARATPRSPSRTTPRCGRPSSTWKRSTRIARLRSQLPPEVEATLREHEQAGTTDSPEYEEAVMVFYGRHLCRVDPWPDWLVQCFELLEANPEVYHSMNGPSEFHVIGTIKDWDITDRLGRIEVPTLIFSGRYDEVTPASTVAAHHAIPGSEYVVMEESSHMSQAEQPEETLALVRDFLSRAEATGT